MSINNFVGRIKVFRRRNDQALKVKCVTVLADGTETIDYCTLNEIKAAFWNAARSDYGALVSEETHKPEEYSDE